MTEISLEFTSAHYRPEAIVAYVNGEASARDWGRIKVEKMQRHYRPEPEDTTNNE